MGPVGVGWSLGQSVITIDLSDSADPWSNPVYMLDGTRLVPGPTGNLVPEILDGREIVASYDPLAGTTFRVYSQDGWLLEYGVSDDSRLAVCSPTISTGCVTAVALLTRAVDPHGLALRYEYADLGDPFQAYLTKISYSLDEGTAEPPPSPSPVGPLREVEFHYEPLTAPRVNYRYRERQELGHVLDRVEMWVDHTNVRTYDLTYETRYVSSAVVLTRVEETGLVGFGAPMTRTLAEFEYSDEGVTWDSWADTPWPADCSDGSASELHAADPEVPGVTMDWFDVNGDAMADCVRVDGTNLTVLSHDWAGHSGPVDPTMAMTEWTDTLTGVGLSPMEALRRFGEEEPWAEDNPHVLSELVDFNGDGHVDRLAWTGWGGGPTLWYWEADGPMSWASPVPIAPSGTLLPDQYIDQEDPDPDIGTVQSIIDVTGDGLPDLVEVHNVGGGPFAWYVYRNEGGSFGPQETWPAPGPDLGFDSTFEQGEYDYTETLRGLADLNSDGILDYVRVQPDPNDPTEQQTDCGPGGNPAQMCRWWVHWGTGYGFAPPETISTRLRGENGAYVPLSRLVQPICDGEWDPIYWVFLGCEIISPLAAQLPGVHLQDLDLDGTTDLVQGNLVSFHLADGLAPPYVAVLPGEGATFSGSSRTDYSWNLIGRYQDVDGDGFVEWFDGITQADPVDVAGDRILPANLLTTVRHPLGGETYLDYEAVVGLASETTGSWIGTTDALPRMWALAEVTHSAADVGGTSYSYSRPVLTSRRLDGFQLVTATADDGSRTETTYHVGDGFTWGSEWPLAGLPSLRERYGPDPAATEPLESTSWTWNAAETVAPGLWSVDLQSRQGCRHGSGGETLCRSWSYTHDPTTGRRLTAVDEGGSAGDPDDVHRSWTWLAGANGHPHDGSIAIDVLSSVETVIDGSRADYREFDVDPDSYDLLTMRRELSDGVSTTMHSWDVSRDAYGFVTARTDAAGDLTTASWAADYLSVDVSVTTNHAAPSPTPPITLPSPTPFTHVWSTAIDSAWGGVAQRSYGDAGGAYSEQTLVRDAFGRPQQLDLLDPDPPSSLDYTAAIWNYDLDPADPYVQVSRFAWTPASSTSPPLMSIEKTYLDAFGRAEQIKTSADGGSLYSSAWLLRDLMGRPIRTNHPYQESTLGRTAAPWTILTYTERSFGLDGRTSSTQVENLPAGSPEDFRQLSWDVLGGELVLTEETEHDVAVPRFTYGYLDERGRLLRMQDALGNQTQYTNDALGRLTNILDAGGNLTTITYDSWGRRTELADPDLSQCGADPTLCPWEFTWNPDGTLASSIDANGYEVASEFDELKRPLWQTGGCESSPGFPCADPEEGTAFFFYDGVGTGGSPHHGAWELGGLTAVIDPSGTTDFALDAWGRPWHTRKDIDGEVFEIEEDLDSWGNPHRVEVADGPTTFDAVLYAYDAAGRLQTATDEVAGTQWISQIDRSPTTGFIGVIESLGGGITRSRGHGFDYRLSDYSASVAATALPPTWDGTVQDVVLDYDAAGRVASRYDAAFEVGGNPSEEFYSYDMLDRLLGVSGPDAGYARTYAYDALGNLTFNSLQQDKYGDGTYVYPSTVNDGPHAVRGIGLESFTYDFAGALVYRDRTGPTAPYTQSYSYGADGRLRSTTRTEGGVPTKTGGLLDAFKRRVRMQVDIGADGSIDGEALLPDQQIERRDGVSYKVVWANGERIAETSDPVVGPFSVVRFFFEDHQGQQSGAVDLDQVLGGTSRYIDHSLVRRDPHGNVVQGEEDLVTRDFADGLPSPVGDETWLGWRLYDTEVGRFLQADTLASATARAGQGLNRYRYGWNSPTHFSDPDGHWEIPTSPPLQGVMGGGVPVAPPTPGFEGLPGAGAGYAAGSGGLAVGVAGYVVIVGHAADPENDPGNCTSERGDDYCENGVAKTPGGKGRGGGGSGSGGEEEEPQEDDESDVDDSIHPDDQSVPDVRDVFDDTWRSRHENLEERGKDAARMAGEGAVEGAKAYATGAVAGKASGAALERLFGGLKDLFRARQRLKKLPSGRGVTKHGGERMAERGFSGEKVDAIIDNNRRNRTSSVDAEGRKTWEYRDNRGNTVVTNEQGDVISVFSSAEDGTYIPKGRGGP